MITGTPSAEQVEGAVEQVLEKVRADQIVLFGSAARGEMLEGSDIGLLVIREGTEGDDGWWYIEVDDTPVNAILRDRRSAERERASAFLATAAALAEGRNLYLRDGARAVPLGPRRNRHGGTRALRTGPGAAAPRPGGTALEVHDQVPDAVPLVRRGPRGHRVVAAGAGHRAGPARPEPPQPERALARGAGPDPRTAARIRAAAGVALDGRVRPQRRGRRDLAGNGKNGQRPAPARRTTSARADGADLEADPRRRPNPAAAWRQRHTGGGREGVTRMLKQEKNEPGARHPDISGLAAQLQRSSRDVQRRTQTARLCTERRHG